MKRFIEHYEYLKTRTDIVRNLSPIKKILLVDDRVRTRMEYTVTFNFKFDSVRYTRQKTARTFEGNLLF